MRAFRFAVAVMAIVIAVGSWVGVGSGQQPATGGLPGSTLGATGEAVYPAFEGWGPLKDGTNALQVGYFNRNKAEVIDVPVGPNNRIEPGGPDMGQPTHFEPGRHYGVFDIQVPKDFGAKKITWTLVANGKTSVVQFSLTPPYWIDFYKNAAKGNTPPVIKFAAAGPEYSGPTGVVANMTATVGQPLTLTLWAKDRPNTYDPEEGLPPEARSGRGRGADGGAAARAARGRGGDQNFDFSAAVGRGGPGGRAGRGAGPQPDVSVTWKIHRGASPVKFANDVIRLFNEGDVDKVMEATTTATFSAAGDYILRAQVNDQSGDGGGGEQCCWTNALVKVAVK